MKLLRKTLIVLMLSATTAMAGPVSEASVKQLLDVTQARKLVDGMFAHVETLMDNAVQQALQGKKPTPKQQQAISNMKKKMVAILKVEMAWDKLEPMYVRLYKQSFTEEEVAGMLAFYKTPAGQALITKMPALMQQTMLEVQKMMGQMTPKFQEIQEQFFAEMQSDG